MRTVLLSLRNYPSVYLVRHKAPGVYSVAVSLFAKHHTRSDILLNLGWGDGWEFDRLSEPPPAGVYGPGRLRGAAGERFSTYFLGAASFSGCRGRPGMITVAYRFCMGIALRCPFHIRIRLHVLNVTGVDIVMTFRKFDR